jgi:hypothetical protein
MSNSIAFLELSEDFYPALFIQFRRFTVTKAIWWLFKFYFKTNNKENNKNK